MAVAEEQAPVSGLAAVVRAGFPAVVELEPGEWVQAAVRQARVAASGKAAAAARHQVAVWERVASLVVALAVGRVEVLARAVVEGPEQALELARAAELVVLAPELVLVVRAEELVRWAQAVEAAQAVRAAWGEPVLGAQAAEWVGEVPLVEQRPRQESG